MSKWNLSDYPECKTVSARMNKTQIADLITESQAIRGELDMRGSILKGLYESENPVAYEGMVQDTDGGSQSSSGRTTLKKFLTDTDTAMERGLSVTKITNIDSASPDYLLQGFPWLRAGEKKIAETLVQELSELNCVHSVLSYHYQDSLSDTSLLRATQEALERETAIVLRRLFVGLVVANEMQKLNSDTQKRIQNRMMSPLPAQESFQDYMDHDPTPNLGLHERVDTDQDAANDYGTAIQARLDKINRDVQEQQAANATVRASKYTAKTQATDNSNALVFQNIRFQVTMSLAILVFILVVGIGARRSFGLTSYFTNILLIAVIIAVALMLLQDSLILYPLVSVGILNV